jgi:hypothetical protein
MANGATKMTWLGPAHDTAAAIGVPARLIVTEVPWHAVGSAPMPPALHGPDDPPVRFVPKIVKLPPGASGVGASEAPFTMEVIVGDDTATLGCWPHAAAQTIKSRLLQDKRVTGRRITIPFLQKVDVHARVRYSGLRPRWRTPDLYAGGNVQNRMAKIRVQQILRYFYV